MSLKTQSDNPDSGVGVARIKRDRFIDLRAEKKGGIVTTHPLQFTHQGGRIPERGILTLNADASSGSVSVELLDENGKTIPGFSEDECLPMTVDELDHIIRWKNQPTLYPVIGTPVRMRLYMQNATIYGFDVLKLDPELPSE